MTRFFSANVQAYPALVFRFYLGGLFVYASMYKINYPLVFAETIANYQIVPEIMVNLTAVFLPWLELTAGVMLILGIRARAAAAVITGLMAVFTVAVIVVLYRGTPIGCGCFTGQESQITIATVFRDLAWTLMALHVFFFDRMYHLEERVTWKLEKDFTTVS